MNQSYWIGVDVGGANIKIADSDGKCDSIPFRMWTDFESLPKTLNELLRNFSTTKRPFVAATMTGELADCFASKEEGVSFICESLAQATCCKCLVYRIPTDRERESLVPVQQASQSWKSVAAANWHALASLVAGSVKSNGILFDIGSTTTDIIPFARNHCISKSVTDTDRIRTSELVYTGVVRSPVCALVQDFDFDGQHCSIAQELFATTIDAYLVLGKIPESSEARFTADGRPATIACARQRLARCLCADAFELDESLIVELAQRVAKQQLGLIEQRFGRVCTQLQKECKEPLSIVVSGEGEWLAREIAISNPQLNVIALDEIFGSEISESAPAFAVAKLAKIFCGSNCASGAIDASC